MTKANSSDLYSHFSNIKVGTDEGGGNIILPGTSGTGLKVGDDTIAFGWHDITAPVVTRGVGATDPAWTQIGATNFYAYLFALNDQAWFNFHIPHDYVPGTDIYLHMHWFCDGTDTNTVKWEYRYVFAKGFDQEAYDFATADAAPVYSEQAGPGTAYQAMVSETDAITISNLEVDGILMVNVKRVTNGGTDNTDSIYVSTGDVHYQSTNMSTPNKAPNFYTT